MDIDHTTNRAHNFLDALYSCLGKDERICKPAAFKRGCPSCVCWGCWFFFLHECSEDFAVGNFLKVQMLSPALCTIPMYNQQHACRAISGNSLRRKDEEHVL